MLCSLVLTKLLLLFFRIPSSSHNASLFFFSLPPYLLASHACTLHPPASLVLWMFHHLFHHRFHHWFFVSTYFCHCHLPPLASAITTCSHLPIPTYFHHHRLFLLACSYLPPPSLFVPACFCHHQLILHANPHHCHLFMLASSHLLLPSLLLQVPYLLCHLLACFIVYMFEFWIHPPCLVLLPFSICARGGA